MTYNMCDRDTVDSFAASMCAGPTSKVTMIPAGPLTLQLPVVVLLLAWQSSKIMGVIPWSKGMK